MNRTDRLALSHLWVAIVAFGVAAAMAFMQALSRASLDLPWRSAKMYYLSVTAHGVLMALVFTTFFIMAFGYVVVTRALDRPPATPGLAWAGFWIALAGTLAAVWAILTGRATVLYTFYPPLKAHPAFYIGLTLVVVGSWCWAAVMLLSYRAWRKEHPDAPAPLVMHGMLATVIVWLIATVGVAAEMLLQLIPWSLGWSKTIDPVLARMLFWYFGHPLVYFWLLPAYVIWYTVLPRVAGGKLFSDPLARLVFVLFIVLSTPVGFHHQFMDPGVSAGWKLLHTFLTMGILFPSFVTAFTVTASMEVAGRMQGARGWLDWLGKLPWRDPLFSSVALSMILFAFGGIGGAINASFGMNAVVHNTAWIQGHFHLTVGSAAALTFMGASYWLLPRLTGRELELALLARVQPYLWFLGMLLFSFSNHITGLMGMPRRIYDASYDGATAAQAWRGLTEVSAAGGLLLFASAGFFILVMVGTALAGKRREPEPVLWTEPLEPVSPRRTLLDRYGLWAVVAVILVLIAYAYPLWAHLRMARFGSPGFSPF
ncbi:MAG TPA: b(o/a)3-type cytochrome-c oxidase subunit 1 [Gemmatimonadales bacterium]|jgi:cytochrome c oxidase subunit 1|nr:b(o/a)3-type cytochrome-c oxidase subunit 1 [Gemmatimonadales bacterium]